MSRTSIEPGAMLTFNSPWQDVEGYANREWLITNGLGGYASGTLCGVGTRRYHGLFMPNLAFPKGRHLLISRLEETINTPHQHLRISGGPHGASSDVEEHLRWTTQIRVGDNIVQWIYSVPGAVLEKTILMPHLCNTVMVRYRVLEVEGDALALQLRPFLPFRRQDAPLVTGGSAGLKSHAQDDALQVAQPETGLLLRMKITGSMGSRFHPESESITEVLTREQARGYACHEMPSSPGYFVAPLTVGQPLLFIATVHEWHAVERDFDLLMQEEAQRLQRIHAHAIGAEDAFVNKLVAAADQFLMRPESRPADAVLAQAQGHLLRSVIAGYHWFGDWGRDTMISLEGLMLCTGRHGEARATLLTFSKYVRDGLLPNLFPEGENAGLYHTVDASLWYFHAIARYLHYTHDRSLLNELLPVLRDIIAHHVEGTRFGIHMDDDGLIAAASPEQPLTWMDAHDGDWIVTPRRGKPVEIQALWYNALRLMALWEAESPTATRYLTLAARARTSFNARFWNQVQQALYDVIDGDVRADASLRPNQVFAISLDHPVLDEVHWAAVLDTVRTHLLTPYGLRTLTREHPDYRPTYSGNLKARDGAYHQGTVWPWLLGHFIDAWLKVYPDTAAARSMLAAFPEHLREAGVSTISEVFDAQWPHIPHGCIAQAWSVAEVLRAWLRTGGKLSYSV